MMLYSDEDLVRWWDRISKQEQRDTLEIMVEKMTNGDFAQSLFNQWARGEKLSPKQIGAIRKWSRD